MKTNDIIDELYGCAAECTKFYASCMIAKNKNSVQLKSAMRIALECAEECKTTARLIEERYENSDFFLYLCGHICQKCAIECNTHLEIQHSKPCAEVCKRCSKMCFSIELESSMVN